MDEPTEALSAYRKSMPPSYAVTYDDIAVEEHAAIVARRGEALAHVELWRRGDGGEAALCVVADDRPGLLSLISAAIGAHALETLDAKIYCRAREGMPAEAVDLFFVKRPESEHGPTSITARDIGAIRHFLTALLRSEIDVRSAMRKVSSSHRLMPLASARVAFEGDGSVLVVEADNRTGLLMTVTTVLSEMHTRIVESSVSTTAGRACDRFELAEPDGQPLSEARRRKIAFAVLLGIERLGGPSAG